MTGSDVANMYAAAAKRYFDLTGKKIDSLDRFDTADELISAVNDQNTQFKHFREKGGTVTKALSLAVKPIELVGNMAAGAASMAFPPSSMVFGAAMYLINAAKGVSSSLDAIVALLERLKDFTVRLKVYNKTDISEELREKLTEILVTVIDIFARSTKKVSEGFLGRIKMMSKNVLLGNDSGNQGLLESLNALTKSEGQLVGAETLYESKRTGKGVEEIQTSLSSVSLGVDEIRTVMEQTHAQAKEEKDQKYLELVKAALSPSAAPQDRYDQIKRERVPNSGDWIYSEEALTAWIETGRDPILWIQGNPGSGKSFLTYNIITHLHDIQKDSSEAVPPGTPIAYFFFRDNNDNTRSFLQALNDLSYQLTQSDPAYAKYVISTVRDGGELSTIRITWQKLFAEYWLTGGDDLAYVCLDGLDESFDEDREIFFELLGDLRDAGDNCRLRIAMTGRPHVYDEIVNAVQTASTIYVDATKNSSDIANYVEASIKKSRVLSRVSKKLKERVIETLISKAGGMFMWVKLMIADLSKKSRESAIEKALDDAPKGLTEMLVHALEGFSSRLEEEDASDLNDMLAWVCLARRPLTLGEVDAMLRLKSEEGEAVLFLEGKLRQQYSAFFTLVRADRLTTSDLMTNKGTTIGDDMDDETSAGAERDEPDDFEGEDDVENQTDFDSHLATTTVAFSHASISDFFRNPSQGKVKASGEDHPLVGVNLDEAHLQLAKTCIDLVVDQTVEQRVKEAASLVRFAAANWIEHLQQVDLAKVDPDVRVHIALNVLKMLQDPVVILKYASPRNWRFYTKDHTSLLQKWLTDDAVKEELPAEASTWLDAIGDAASLDLFQPTMKQIAVRWLHPGHKDFWHVQACPVIIHTWLGRRDGKPEPEKVPTLSAAEIEEAAKWCELEQDAEWYQRMAMSFREQKYDDEAIKYFEKALEMNPSFWNARGGISIMKTRQGKLEESIALDEANLPSIDQDTTSSEEWKLSGKVACNKRMALNYWSLARQITEDVTHDSLELDKKSFEHYDASFRLKDTDYESLLACVTHLGEVAKLSLPWGPCADDESSQKHVDKTSVPTPADCYSRTMVYVHALHEKQTEKGHTNFVDCLLSSSFSMAKYWDEDLFRYVSRASHATGEAEWIEARYREAIAVARKERETITAGCLHLCLAALYFDSLQDHENDEKAIRLVESVALEAAVSSKVETEIGYLRRSALNFLGELCVGKAVDEADPSKAERWVRKMERVWARSSRRNPTIAHDAIPPSDIAFYLAAWYVRHGRVGEARDMLRPHVKDSLALLSDDDPNNDTEGWMMLGWALLTVGDHADCIAVLQSIRPYVNGLAVLDGDEVEEDTADSTEMKSVTEKAGEPQSDQANKDDGKKTELKDESNEDVVKTEEGKKDEESHSKEAVEVQNEHQDEHRNDDQEGDDDAGQEREDEGEGEGEEEEEDLDDFEAWSCDGPCERSFTNFDNCNCCLCCGEYFCDKCFQFLQEDRFPYRLCGKNHGFLKISPLKTRLKEGTVLAGETVMELDEWKKQLKRSWGV